MSTGDDAVSIPAHSAAHVGSARLAAALAVRDVPAIGQALRHDYVVVPVTRGPSGEPQIAVVSSADPAMEGTYELCVFSSAETFAAYQAPTAELGLQRGSALVPFLEEHRELIARVVFDPAGPHPVQALVEDVLAVLAPRVTDDDVAWAAGAAVAPPVDGTAAARPVVALDLPLGRDWTAVELGEPRRTDKQVRSLAKQQLRAVPLDRSVRTRLTEWLRTTARTAASTDARFLAFLVRPTPQGLLALSVTMHWHALGPEIGGRPHLEALIERLRADAGAGGELEATGTHAGVRHVRLEEVGGTPVLVTDYWLPFPDGRGLARLSFTSPYPDRRPSIHEVTDAAVRAASWVSEREA